MKIELGKIKASPKPIRTSWDEKAIEDLRWSLMEEGQVEPVGVHESGDGYTLVWGHRRTEAARRAAWKEIEAVIVPQDEVNNLIQAGIENLAGEDMSIDDKTEWAYRLIQLGLTQQEISRRSTVNRNTIYAWLTYKKEKEQGVNVDIYTTSRDEGVRKIYDISQVLGNDLDAKKAVANKVSEDKLGQHQTRQVAEAYRDAPTPEVKAQILKTPIVSRDTSADILRRSINRVEMDTGIKLQTERSEWEKQQDAKKAENDFDGVVKTFLDDIRLFRQKLDSAKAFVKFGKYSPEAAAFTIRKIDGVIDELKNYKELLEEVK